MTKYKNNVEEEYQSSELTMKKGRWSLWHESNGTSTLWHQCSKGKEVVYGEKKTAIVVYPIKYRTKSKFNGKSINPRWCCGMCDSKPPESILVPWMMHNFDDLSSYQDNPMWDGYRSNPGGE